MMEITCNTLKEKKVYVQALKDNRDSFLNSINITIKYWEEIIKIEESDIIDNANHEENGD